MLYATGMTREDMDKPQVGIGSVWYEGNSCNMHLLDLAAEVKKGVEEAGLVGMRFNTIGVSDGISMGTEGMSFSLQSRDLIADSIETIMGAQWYDALIALPGCDKNMPGCLIAMGRLNRQSIMVYGGHDQTRTRQQRETGHRQRLSVLRPISRRTDQRRRTPRNRPDMPVPGPVPAAACTPPTRWRPPSKHSACRFPTRPAFPPKTRTRKTNADARERRFLELLKADIKPRDIMTRAAFENAMVTVMALGGSTNAVLHLIAMARSVGVDLTIDDFQSVSDRVPYLADLKPSGKFVQEDLHSVGGTPAVMKYLLKEGLMDGSCLDGDRQDAGRKPRNRCRT